MTGGFDGGIGAGRDVGPRQIGDARAHITPNRRRAQFKHRNGRISAIAAGHSQIRNRDRRNSSPRQ